MVSSPRSPVTGTCQSELTGKIGVMPLAAPRRGSLSIAATLGCPVNGGLAGGPPTATLPKFIAAAAFSPLLGRPCRNCMGPACAHSPRGERIDPHQVLKDHSRRQFAAVSRAVAVQMHNRRAQSRTA